MQQLLDQGDALALEDRIEVPISPFPVPAARPSPTARPATFFARVSRQRYVEDSDVERLIEALARRGIGSGAGGGAGAGVPGPAAGAAASAIVGS